MINLKDKIVLITGASGGIGKATAKLFHNLGATVAISGTNEEKLSNLAAELGDRNRVISCNLSDLAQVKQLIPNVLSAFGRVDIVVCNAGITKDNLAIRMKDEDFKLVIDVNLNANFILVRDAIKNMLKNKYGRIINISSVVGVSGNAGQTNYSASKAGLIGMTKSFALEYSSKNITCNIVAPGFIDTEMTSKLDESYKQSLIKSIPSNRFGSPEDIASTIAFLASDQASYITGQTFHVNGGMLMI